MRARVQRLYNEVGEDLGDLLAATSRLLSRMLQHPAIVLPAATADWRFRHIAASAVNSHNVLVVVVTSTGEVHHRLLPIATKLTGPQLRGISDLLNDRLKGAKASAVSRLEMDELCQTLGHLKVPAEVLGLIKDSLASEHEQNVYIDGMLYILREPEFADVDKFSSLISVFERPEQVRAVFAASEETSAVRVIIGAENPLAGVRDCSVVSTGFASGESTLGTIGVVAPRRMDYETAIPAVRLVAERLGESVARMTND
jgi:heat-inducible transcriptional repressor